VHASLIVVLTRGGSTGRLVAKYRPLVPVLTVAVPVLTTDSLTWTCSNEAPARQVSRGAAVAGFVMLCRLTRLAAALCRRACDAGDLQHMLWG
jgi:hypothetical protein